MTDRGSEGGAVVLSRLSGSDATHPKYIDMMLDHFDMGLNISNYGKVVRKTCDCLSQHFHFMLTMTMMFSMEIMMILKIMVVTV